ncbi:DUF2493 domain-containing protein [Streptomyces bauhiniae]|uniref:DUF2493 domain-containing protein n=1 Tax=Streptomyces bauhiniae TaxID=2340725 RepID=UPI0033AF57CF
MTLYRILVTGSRTWDDDTVIGEALSEAIRPVWHDRNVVIVHGACPSGADQMAHEWAEVFGVDVERHPADWNRYCKAAGPRRNAHMVHLGADLCLAFIRDGSRGATHCADLAEKAGITVRRYTA